MKKYILLFISFHILFFVSAQSTFWQDTELAFSFAFQKHDDRWFDYPEYLKRQFEQKTPGSFIYSAGIRKPLFQKKGFQIQSGLSLIWERNSHHRPYEKGYLLYPASEGGYTDEATSIKKYNIFSLGIPLTMKQKLLSFKKNRFFIQLTTTPIFDFRRTISSYNAPSRRGYWHFSFYSIEIHPAIGFDTAKWGVEVFYNIYQLKKKDKIRFYDDYYFNFSQEQLDEFWGNGYEDYNPTKMGVKVSWRWKANK